MLSAEQVDTETVPFTGNSLFWQHEPATNRTRFCYNGRCKFLDGEVVSIHLTKSWFVVVEMDSGQTVWLDKVSLSLVRRISQFKPSIKPD